MPRPWLPPASKKSSLPHSVARRASRTCRCRCRRSPARRWSQAGVNSVLDLPRLVPNFNVMRGTQTANVRLSIRGVGASSNSAIDPSIGTFIDGVYVPRPGSLFGALNDLSGAEVLRGPQGTLFGRNSTVGAVLLRSVSPRRIRPVAPNCSTATTTRRSSPACWTAGRRQVRVPIRGPHRVARRLRAQPLRQQGLRHVQTSAVRVGMNWAITDSLNWTLKYDTRRSAATARPESKSTPRR